jgi:nucleoside-diphosphate-sugar epimerase
MRAFVTGASGFIGQAVVARLRAAGAEVHAPGRDEADLLQAEAAASWMARLQPSHLVHLAWTTMPGRYWDDPANHDWVLASLALLRAFAAAGGRHAFLAGSCAEYDWQDGHLDEASTALRPATRYGRCKAALGQLAPDLASAIGVTLAWGRIHFPYGPGERPERLVPYLVSSALQGRVAATGPGDVARDFIHVADLADAIVQLAKAGHHGALDLCSGHSTPVAEIAAHIGRLTGREDLLRIGALPARPGEPRLLASTPRTLLRLGWAPKIDLASGLRQCVQAERQRLQAVVA